jgi:hypothetical protein
VNYAKPGTKAARVREVVHRHLLDHDAARELPTSGRFVFYELEQRGDATKPDPADPRTHIGRPRAESRRDALSSRASRSGS